MRILAVDPGSEQSAWLIYNTGGCVVRYTPGGEIVGGIVDNATLARMLAIGVSEADAVAIERIRLYAPKPRTDNRGRMRPVAIAKTVRETCEWVGAFRQAAQAGGYPVSLIERQDEWRVLLGQQTGSDPLVRAALCNRFGGDRKRAVGTKKAPGPLYGIVKDLWAALAVAVTWAELGADVCSTYGPLDGGGA